MLDVFICRTEGDSYVSYKAMIISTGVQLLLLMFEVLTCDKLENDRTMVLWVLVFIPIFFLSIMSIGICVWYLRHSRTFEVLVSIVFCIINHLKYFKVYLYNSCKYSHFILFLMYAAQYKRSKFFVDGTIFCSEHSTIYIHSTAA